MTADLCVQGFGLLKGLDLLVTGFFLVFLFPVGVRHAINHFQSAIVVQFSIELVAGRQHPFAQAVAAKARQVHDVDILCIGSVLQMGDQAAKSLCLDSVEFVLVHK